MTVPGTELEQGYGPGTTTAQDKGIYKPVRILLQTTIPAAGDDWHVGRFSLLRDHLASLSDGAGRPLCEVTARDRGANSDSDDEVLSRLDSTDYDELWLFAVDAGNGLTEADCRGITRFRRRGGGLLTTRDHQDVGPSLCMLGGVGHAHFFHSKHHDPDKARCERDDQAAGTISWPNYHSGSNGYYQSVTPVGPVHELPSEPRILFRPGRVLPGAPTRGLGSACPKASPTGASSPPA